jgi:hypothetical protein
MEPQVVGLSLKFASPVPHDCVAQLNSITREIRNIGNLPITILIGGPGFSLNAEKLIQHVPEIYCGIIYEGEESTPELLKNLQTPKKVKRILFRKADWQALQNERDFKDDCFVFKIYFGEGEQEGIIEGMNCSAFISWNVAIKNHRCQSPLQ